MIHDGGIGEVHRIQAGMQRNIYPGLKPVALQSGLTPQLDWDMWLGPRRKCRSIHSGAFTISDGSGIIQAAR